MRKYPLGYEKVCISAFIRKFCFCGKPMVNELHKESSKKRRQNSTDERDESSSSTSKKIKVTD